MSEPKKFRIGDEVKTPAGRGLVVEVRNFHEAMATLTDAELEVTSRELLARVGMDAPRVWQQLLVKRGHSLRWYENVNVEAIE